MSLIFGNKPEYYKSFDFRILVKVLDAYNNEMKNPTKAGTLK